MLAGISDRLSAALKPNAWLVRDGAYVVSLCSVTALHEPNTPQIGYGTAPGEEGRGAASAGVAAVVGWARRDHRIRALVAETAVSNLASQRVLARNGFVIAGERHDEGDGPLIRWRCNCESIEPSVG